MFRVKTKAGSIVKRFGDCVGKQCGKQMYVHRNYVRDESLKDFIPRKSLDRAERILAKKNPSFKYNNVMYDKEHDIVRFDEAPDFDYASEPHVGKMFKVFPQGKGEPEQTEKKKPIWHHKWTMVKDNYNGFNVEASQRESELYSPKIGNPIGYDPQFDAQLDEGGVKGNCGKTRCWRRFEPMLEKYYV